MGEASEAEIRALMEVIERLDRMSAEVREMTAAVRSSVEKGTQR